MKLNLGQPRLRLAGTIIMIALLLGIPIPAIAVPPSGGSLAPPDPTVGPMPSTRFTGVTSGGGQAANLRLQFTGDSKMRGWLRLK